MPRTTINMHISVLEIINRAAMQCNTSRRDVILALIKRIMRDVDKFQGGFTTVKYQQDCSEEEWHCFNIKLRKDENEFFVDLRKVSKCSISLLISIAVDQYLNELLTKPDKTVHNYVQFCNYVLFREVVEGITCWQSYWGMPEERLKSLKL